MYSGRPQHHRIRIILHHFNVCLIELHVHKLSSPCFRSFGVSRSLIRLSTLVWISKQLGPSDVIRIRPKNRRVSKSGLRHFRVVKKCTKNRINTQTKPAGTACKVCFKKKYRVLQFSVFLSLTHTHKELRFRDRKANRYNIQKKKRENPVPSGRSNKSLGFEDG